MSDNPGMEISEETLARIEDKLREIAELDPAELPGPAAELADLLSAILDDQDSH